MKPIQRKAIELALEALKGSYAVHPDEAITALQDALDEAKEIEGLVSIVRTEALAEHEKREPVAWGSTNETGEVLDCVSNQCKTNYPHMVDFDLPLYAAPVSAKRELVDLTCQEITALIMEGAAGGGWQGFAERVLAAFKEKNK